MKWVELINEAAYPANLGFEEMVKLYQKATDDQIKKLEDIIRKGDEGAFRKFVKKILGVTLK
jgi:hypothetical protein